MFFRLLLASIVICGLSAQPKPRQFEVATIRPVNPSTPNQGDPGMHVNQNLLRMTASPMRVIIAAAYEIKPYQVIGPDWLASDRYEINATLPEGATLQHVPEMLRTLLQERFGLNVEKVQKQSPAYVLEKGKKPLSLKPVELDPEDSDMKNSVGRGSGMISLGRGAGFSLSNLGFEARKVTMEQLVESLALYLDRPVVNRTSIDGRYDVSWAVSPEDRRAMGLRMSQKLGNVLQPEMLRILDNATYDSLYNAIENVGLKLTPRTEPVEFLNVLQIRKTPTEN